MILKNFKNKLLGIAGFGKTGKSIADSLIASNANVAAYDDYDIKDPKYKNLYKNLADETTFKKLIDDGLCGIVISPGISTIWPQTHPVVQLAYKYNIVIINDIDLLQQNIKDNCHLTSITGTNGKSTTTALIHHIFASSGKNSVIGGNFGEPVLSLTDSVRDRHENVFYVLELSSYQLETCKILGFDTAILLNITPDHLTRHGGMYGYIHAKQKIFANFHEHSNAIISIDDEYCSEIYKFLISVKHPHVIPISGKQVPDYGVGWSDDHLVDNMNGKNKFICKSQSELDGVHNRQNIAAAYAACIFSSITPTQFCDSISTFHGLEHRQEFIAEINGIFYINDSKATNTESVEQALMRYNNIFWILGGRPKEKGIESLSKYFYKIKHAFLVGEVAENWCELLKKYNVNTSISKTIDVAVNEAYEKSKNFDGQVDVVLLSPACASFDQFSNFEERGEFFKNSILKIKKDGNDKFFKNR